MQTSARVMQAIAAADLSAHAGAQQIRLRPDGVLKSDQSQASATAQTYFQVQSAPHTTFGSASCGTINGRPGCNVTVSVKSAGFLFPKRDIGVAATGYLAYGVIRDDQ